MILMVLYNIGSLTQPACSIFATYTYIGRLKIIFSLLFVKEISLHCTVSYIIFNKDKIQYFVLFQYVRVHIIVKVFIVKINLYLCFLFLKYNTQIYYNQNAGNSSFFSFLYWTSKQSFFFSSRHTRNGDENAKEGIICIVYVLQAEML